VIINIASYSALGYCYFHFVNLGETARRIRLLSELNESKNGLSVDEILQRYNAKEIIENRLSRLLKSGQVIHKDNRYYIGKPVMLFMSKMIVLAKLFILGKSSEFD
jgi:predicted transcriptional regulator